MDVRDLTSSADGHLVRFGGDGRIAAGGGGREGGAAFNDAGSVCAGPIGEAKLFVVAVVGDGEGTGVVEVNWGGG